LFTGGFPRIAGHPCKPAASAAKDRHCAIVRVGSGRPATDIVAS
jgi:hypothetical protein